MRNKKNLLENTKINYVYNKNKKGFFTYYERSIKKFDKIIKESNGERIIQKYLEKNPILLLNAGLKGFFPFASRRCALFSKVELGECFEPDLSFVHADSTGACWTFIELKTANVKLFNKNGDMSRYLNRAHKQIIQWQSWIKDNKAYAQARLGELQKSARIYKDAEFCMEPRFVIIIGRRSTLNKDNNRLRIEMCNSNPRLEIVTYDRLIEPFRFDPSKEAD
ncbi:MAG: Shedu anti-phage system protein SduA domain-containing protein [Candidatus Scalinduaceae bacterium]